MSTPFRQNHTFPIGRILWGAPGKTRDKDNKGKPLTTKDGKPRIECSFGVAFAKNGTSVFWQTDWGAVIYMVGKAAFPHLFQADGTLLPGRKFSFKVTDGDSTEFNENGKRPCDQEGYPGHWVVTFKSSFVPKCYVAQGAAYIEIDPATIKTGHYVSIAGSVDSNGDATKPGVYVNHGLVVYAGAGQEIVSGPDVASAFAKGLGAAPAGMQALPAGSFPAPGQAGGLPAPAGLPAPSLPSSGALPPPVALPTPAALPTAALPTPAPVAVQPAPGFLPAALPTPVPPPAIPAGPVLSAALQAQGATWAQLAAGGWTVEAARTAGHVVG